MDQHILRNTLKETAERGLYVPQFEHDACGTGFVVDVKGRPSHDIVQQALEVLVNLSHRGASGSEPNTGDGAGILIQMPHRFLQKVCGEQGIQLPEPGQYGAGIIFFPQDRQQRQQCQQQFEKIVTEEGQTLLGWRAVPTNDSQLGQTAKDSEPFMSQVFIGRRMGGDDLAFERKLYLIRKRAEKEIRRETCRFYAASLSYKTIIYKGMLLSEQLPDYFLDLSDPDMESAIGLVHSRFSTNTFPSWERAHPYRYVMHNGEINTIRGNVNWMRARESTMESAAFGKDLAKLLPVIDEDGSDTAMFDNALEFLVLNGRSLPHAMMMMIPEPWAKHEFMAPEKRAFYAFHSCLMEPWDGPAAMGFTDGVVVGATLDRNGLRPSRYTVTKDDRVILASETGVLDIPPENVAYKGRLQPGRMLLIDTRQGRIISDDEIKAQIAGEYRYRDWYENNMISLADLPGDGTDEVYPQPGRPQGSPLPDLTQRQEAFGYTFEDLRLIMAPMIENGVEATGSMGNDAPPAVLSDRPQLLYNYFKQLFAQVTNPPIDAIREDLVMDTQIRLGSEGNLLELYPENGRTIMLPHPILTDADLAKLRRVEMEGFQARTLPMLYDVFEGSIGLKRALQSLYEEVDQAIVEGINLIILSDREIERRKAAIPALLACSGLHHHLVRRGTRAQVEIILETGEAREVHHFAVLIGYGADAINPYLAYETIGDILDKELVTGIDYPAAVKHYVKAAVKGVVKIISKMGISTVQSYHSAQIFEALGLARSVVDEYFPGTPSRIEGASLETLAEEVRQRHDKAFPKRPSNGIALPPGGQYQWRQDGEAHLFNPQTIHLLQTAVRENDYAKFKEFATAVNDQNRQLYTLRGLLEFKTLPEPIPLDEVESVESICRRFKTGAMSYGSISAEAHEALAKAMNQIGGKSNTGEGGEDRLRFLDDRNSKIKQVASGRFGVTSEYLVNAEEIQIKMAQGAKPGEGGQLPGKKVYPWIAKVRLSTPGVGLISPPPHHDIYSIEDLAQLIFDLKNANPRARINVKLVSEVGVGTVAAGVAKGHADVVLISGYDGGTGASPQSSIKHAGLPWELGLAETHQTLVLNNLRSRIVVETDGQLKTGRDVVVAALLGAEEFGFATAPLVALGCIMMRVCQKNTCPVGIATQNPELRERFMGDPQQVVNFMHFVAQEMRELMAQLGFRTVNEMIGRTDKLEKRQVITHWKAQGLDLSPILYRPEVGEGIGRYHQVAQQHGLEDALDNELIELCRPVLESCEGAGEQGSKGEIRTPAPLLPRTFASVRATLPIRNTNRAVGTMLGSEVTRRTGGEGLPEDTIHLHFQGSAGQSFGAFVPRGLTLELEGDANDYFGKGLSGGKITVYPPAEADFLPEKNIIIGNVAFYGATSGEAYVRGVAGERFCVRNSGATAVVEGVGDHGCEYMTGGRVVVLGLTGRNFAAGMSGGVAYVLDNDGDFDRRCNRSMVDMSYLDRASEKEIEEVRQMIIRHVFYTSSEYAQDILDRWDEMLPRFIKVMPRDYERMLNKFAEMEAGGLTGDEAIMAAFEANANDLARVTGN
ncbi:MAG: glutamate synthase large subunit [Ardenticatenaceae bacterium]|nr:glutamate synthase large subunit [Ardenticatenaceae bacterium]MCB9443643.1 glutamate synthase large subunit [Ardenticatenaceae bacterium]